MAELFDEFPFLQSDILVIRRMDESDVDALNEITCNEQVYRYIPPFLYRKSRSSLLTAIRNIGGRDFEKKKMIIAGIYLREEPNRLIGLAEMFDRKKRAKQITIGNCLNENYWHRGVATEAIRLMKDYLCGEMGLLVLKAFVMPENIYSARALIHNGFEKEPLAAQGKNWGGNALVQLEEYSYRPR